MDRPYIVEVKFAGGDYQRNQMTFISIESADSWGYNFLCNNHAAEDYRVVDLGTGKVVLEGTDE
jgi:hypothetical protein